MKTTHRSAGCQHIEIANSKLGEVMICPECGVVHMNLQSISVRLDVEAFGVLTQMLSRAQTILERAQQGQHASPELVEKMNMDHRGSSKVH